ncbi:MAG: tandem-95 repeat protein, partial [Actinobacteria bacterium]|nr:tandem-95 repeat protein [Actinomycetota bacterium]
MRALRHLCAAAVFAVGALAAPAAMAAPLVNGDIVINDNDGSTQRILRIDPATAAATPLATITLNIRGLGIDGDGNILVAGYGAEGGSPFPKVLRINPDTGSVTVAASGGLLADPQDVAETADGALVVSDAVAGIVRIEPSGTQRRLAANGALVPGNLNGPAGIAVDATGDLYISNRNAVDKGVLRMDPQTGEYSTVASGTPPFSIPLGVAVERDGRIVVAESNATGGGGVVRVDPALHTAVNFSAGANPMDVGVEPDGTLVTVNASSVARMFRVDPASGARTPFLTDFQIAPSVLAVARINTPPSAVDDGPYVTTGDGTLQVSAGDGVLANDSDVDHDTLTAEVVSDGSNGHVQLGADGSFAYQPNAGFRGLDSFTYVANDGSATSNPATVTIRVNSQPVVAPDEYTVTAGQMLSVDAPGVLANDTDPDGDALVARFPGPTPSGFSGHPDGSFTYSPGTDVSGSVVVPYCAADDVSETCSTVSIQVTPANAAPVADDDSFTTAQGTPLVVDAPGVLANDQDPDGDGLTAHVATDVSHGALQLNPDGSFAYTPDPGFAGNETFTYRASDQALQSAPATVTIAVTSPAAGISIGDAQVAEGDRGSSKMTFTVTRSGPLDRAIRVDYRTLDGTATTGDRDYRSKSGSVRFRAGEA